MSDASLRPIGPSIDSAAAAARLAAGAIGPAGGVAAAAAAAALKAAAAASESQPATPAPPADSVKTAKQGAAAAAMSIGGPASDHGKFLQGAVNLLTKARERQTGAVAIAARGISEIKGPFQHARNAAAAVADKVHAHAINQGDTIRAKVAKAAAALPGEPVKAPEQVQTIIKNAAGRLDKAATAGADTIDNAIRKTAEALKAAHTHPHHLPAKLREAVEDTIKQSPLPLHKELHKSLDRILQEIKQAPIIDSPLPEKIFDRLKDPLKQHPIGDFPLPDKNIVRA